MVLYWKKNYQHTLKQTSFMLRVFFDYRYHFNLPKSIISIEYSHFAFLMNYINMVSQ